MHERERTRPDGLWTHPDAGHSARPRREFTQAERRTVFRQMVITELEGGVLRYSRRRALLRYAEEIGIPTFDANLLIAESQYRAKQPEPIEFDAGALFMALQGEAKPEWLPPGYRLAFALLLAAAIDVVVIGWLVG